MGQAKNRGDFAARQKEAIDAGRTKLKIPEYERPLYVHPGYKPALVNTLTEVSNRLNIYSSIPERPPMFQLGPGAERPAKELETPSDLVPAIK